MKNKHIIRLAFIVAVILLVPFIAMQFSDEIAWDLLDFVAAGVLLFGAGLSYELIASRRDSLSYRVTVGIIIAIILLLIWMELAVGIFGTPWAGS